MKIFILAYFIFSSFAFSQNNCNYAKEEIVSIFKHINKTDSSNINQPKVREKDFYKNFETIIQLMNCSDFEIQKRNYSKKQLKNIENGIQRTFIHIFQIDPERILNDSIIPLIKNQLKTSNLKKSTLIIALSIYKYDHKDDFEDLKNYYLKALKEWDISETELHG